jgi:predicted DNA-binding protein with PD1-like motif
MPLTRLADPREQMPRPNGYDHNSKESAMYVLEVRNDELMDSITRQAAERGITNAAIVALIGAVDSFTVSTTPASDPTAHTYSSYPCQRR